MVFIPGAGYGVAQAGSAVGPAIVEASRHEASEDLKKRQMSVNEAAEARARSVSDEYVQNQRDERTRKENEAKSSVAAYGVMTPDGSTPGTVAPVGQSPNSTVPSLAPAPTPPEVQAAVAAPQAPLDVNQAPPIGSMGQPLQPVLDDNGNISGFIDPATGQPEEPLAGIGKGSPAGSKPISGGARAGDARTRLPQGYGVASKGGTPGPAMDTGAGGAASPADMTKMLQGKTIASPNQGQGYLDQAAALEQRAAGVQTRLAEALKTIETQYANDPTQIAYLKANLIAKVTPSIAQMQGNAANLRNQGQLVDHMHKGAVLAEGMIGHMMQGGEIDDKFINAHQAEIKELGFNPTIMAGMHLEKSDPTSKGFIVNKGGFIIPPNALMLVANPALPWEDRAKGWDHIMNMYKDQMKAKTDLVKTAMDDPLRFVRGSIELNDKLNTQYSDADQKYKTLTTMAAQGGELTVNGPDGKPVKVQLKPQYATDKDWIANMGALGPDNRPKDPAAYAVYTQQIKPLLDVRERLASNSAFVVHGAKNAVNALTPGQQEALGPLKAYFAGLSGANKTGIEAYRTDKSTFEALPENAGKSFPKKLSDYGVSGPR